MKRPSNLTLVIISGAMLVTSFVAFRNHLPYTGVPLSPKELPKTALAMEDAYLIGISEGSKIWSIRAERVEMKRDYSTTIIKKITDGKIFDKGKIILRVNAGEAKYNIRTKNLVLSEGINIQSSDGRKIIGKGASWNSNTSTLRSIGQVAYKTKWSSILANKLVIDLKRQEVNMWDVYMQLNIKEAQNAINLEGLNNAR